MFDEIADSPYAQAFDRIIEDYHILECMKELSKEIDKSCIHTLKDARRGNSMSPKEFGQLKHR